MGLFTDGFKLLKTAFLKEAKISIPNVHIEIIL